MLLLLKGVGKRRGDAEEESERTELDVQLKMADAEHPQN